MTKKIFAILVAATVCLSMALSASAYTSQYVYDPEYNLSDNELYELNNYAAGIETQSGYALIFCIISDNGGMSNAEFAEEFTRLTVHCEGVILTLPLYIENPHGIKSILI